MGGRSVESEVSFNSGRTVCDHIDVDLYQVIPIFQKKSGGLYLLPLKFLHRGKISDFEHRLEKEAKKIDWDDLKKLVDFVYIATHGFYAEDGTLQGMLEVLKIPYLGSKVFASACGIDKNFQKQILRMNGIEVANDLVLSPKQIKNISKEKISKLLQKSKFKFPLFVKPTLEGSSLGISFVESIDEIIPALEKACYKDVTREQSVLVEEKIEGMEFTCIGLQKSKLAGLDFKSSGEWFGLPITEVIHEKGTAFHDYEQKYMPGRSTKITPARCSEKDSKKIQDVCVKASEILGFTNFFRTDGFLTKDGKIVIADPNTLSGMGPASFLFHQAAEIGINHTKLINYLINLELDKQGLLEGIFLNKKIKTKKDMRKKIAVLFGGDSNEREISLESGRNVCYKLSPSKYEVIPIFVDDQMNLYKLCPRLLIQNSTREIKDQARKDIQIKWADLPKISDFVFIALHGGKGENGSVQGALETLGLPYNGSGVLASSLCMDKHKTNNFLSKKGFDVPKSTLIGKKRFLEKQSLSEDLKKNGFTFPLIIKPPDDGCSMYVKKVNNRVDLEKKIKKYFESRKDVVMIEECLFGMELTCGVVGNDNVKVFPPSNSVCVGDILSVEEKFLPGAGENQTPAPLSTKDLTFVQKVIKDVYLTLGCKGYVRIDCFYQDEKTSPTGKKRLVILEINTLPALTPATCIFHQAAEIGINPMELIGEIVELGFDLHKNFVFKGSQTFEVQPPLEEKVVKKTLSSK